MSSFHRFEYGYEHIRVNEDILIKQKRCIVDELTLALLACYVHCLGMDSPEILAFLDGDFARQRYYPWLIICLPYEYPITGHLASLRDKQIELPVTSYSYIKQRYHDGFPALTSIIIVSTKEKLKELSVSCPEIFAEAWLELQDQPPDSPWICLADDLDRNWVEKVAAFNEIEYRTWQAANQQKQYADIRSNDLLMYQLVTGEQALEDRKWKLAHRFFLAAISQKPDYAPAWCGLANSLRGLHRLREAVDIYKKVLTLDPLYFKAFEHLFDIYTMMNQESLSGTLCMEYIEKDARFLRILRQISLREGEIKNLDEPAFEADCTYVRQHPYLPNVLKKWANYNNHIEAYELAEVTMAQALILTPCESNAWIDLGVILLNQKKTPAAIIAFEQAVRFQAHETVSWNNLGLAYCRNDNFEKAFECLDKSLTIFPRCHFAWDSLGETYLRMGQIEKAIQAFKTALAIKPKHPESIYNLAMAALANPERIYPHMDCRTAEGRGGRDRLLV